MKITIHSREHMHDFYEINVIIKGIGTHTINERKSHVKAGDVFVIPPYVLHSDFRHKTKQKATNIYCYKKQSNMMFS